MAKSKKPRVRRRPSGMVRKARAAAKLLATPRPTREQLKRALYGVMYGASRQTIAQLAPEVDYADLERRILAHSVRLPDQSPLE